MTSTNILEPPAPGTRIDFGSGFGQRFLVTVDTEEEFDWDAPIARTSHGVSAAPHIREFQRFCEAHGVIPLYLVDYPIATSPEAIAVLRPAAEQGRAEIGLHLHPWVSPPLVEKVTPFNTFAGNLPPEQERAKFLHLLETIEANLATRPIAYRAGRYGVGPHTAALLKEAGFRIDTSVRSLFDYREGHGPDFRNHPLAPYWLDADRSLAELPVTTVFRGALRKQGQRLFPLAGQVPRLPGVLSRTGLLERIPLTPEGVASGEAIRAIDIAVADRLPVLVFSFHSPSLGAGHTPYVRSQADVEAFYAWWREVLTHLERRGIRPTTAADIARSLSLA